MNVNRVLKKSIRLNDYNKQNTNIYLLTMEIDL